MTPTRKSYSKEKQIEVTQMHYEIQKLLLRLNIFSINCKQVRSWVKDEESILQMNSRSKDSFYAKEKNPLMEKKLCEEFLELRKKGTSVKT